MSAVFFCAGKTFAAHIITNNALEGNGIPATLVSEKSKCEVALANSV